VLILAVDEKLSTAKPFCSAVGTSDVKQYLNLPRLSSIDARFCSQSRIITSVLGKTATAHVGLRRRRTRRDSLLLCSYILSAAIDGCVEDEAPTAGERLPFSSIGKDDVERLPFSKRTSPLEGNSSMV